MSLTHVVAIQELRTKSNVLYISLRLNEILSAHRAFTVSCLRFLEESLLFARLNLTRLWDLILLLIQADEERYRTEH